MADKNLKHLKKPRKSVISTLIETTNLAMVFLLLIFQQRPQILNPLQHKDTIVTRLMFGNKNPRNFSNFKTLATFMNQAPPINNNVEGT